MTIIHPAARASTGMTPSLALTALVLLSLLLFWGWRLLRCMLQAAPDSFHLSMYEKLTNRRLIAYKVGSLA